MPKAAGVRDSRGQARRGLPTSYRPGRSGARCSSNSVKRLWIVITFSPRSSHWQYRRLRTSSASRSGRPVPSAHGASVAINLVPDAPSGWPSAIAPPLTLSLAGSAPIALSHAIGIAANASLTSNRSMSSSFMPARANAFCVAGIGSSSMITGSPAVTVRFTMRASGVRLKRFSAASLTTITPDAPSVIWLALAAVMVPPSSSVLT